MNWWLLGTYSYEVLNTPLISDALFDEIAVRLTAEWDDIEHPHKAILDRTILKSGLAANGKFPTIVKGAAQQLLKEGPMKIYTLTITHTDLSTVDLTVSAKDVVQAQQAVLRTLLEGYRLPGNETDGIEFVSPHFVAKVVLKSVGEDTPKKKAKTKDVEQPTNKRTSKRKGK